MSKYDRSDRRHERNRVLAKRLKQLQQSPLNDDADSSWMETHARKLVNTGTICSCHMCGNTRRHHGNAKRTFTRQELTMRLKLREMD